MRWRTIAVCGAALCLGCGLRNSENRQPIKGKVTINGAAVQHADIRFESEGCATRHATGATITDGDYAITAAKGVPPGKYLVRINTPEPRGTAADQAPGAPTPIPRELIPPEYNAKSTQAVDVKEGQNVFDFHIVIKK